MHATLAICQAKAETKITVLDLFAQLAIVKSAPLIERLPTSRYRVSEEENLFCGLQHEVDAASGPGADMTLSADGMQSAFLFLRRIAYE